MEREAFLKDLRALREKYGVKSYFFYGIDCQGRFGDFDVSNDEVVTMVLAVLQNRNLSGAAKKISEIIVKGLERHLEKQGDEGGFAVASNIDGLTWTWRSEW